MAQPKYEIIERIGAGGMAEVFKASSTSLEGFQKLVAIKRVLPNLTENERFVQMFLDEAKIALPLNHTNIVQTFDLGKANETYFIVMEYVEGTDLKEVVEELNDRGEQFSIPEVALIGVEICKGLAHAHNKTDPSGEELDIVHRDISPPNILVSRDGEVKITDFGLAKAKSQAELTDPGVVKGKFGYLSPEAAEGEDIDERTDIFAVGILLWEMLTGKRLFLGESDHDTLKIVREAEIPRLERAGRSVPKYLERIVRKALAKDLGNRFQTAEQLGEALADFMYRYGEPVTSFSLVPYVEALLEDRKLSEQPELAPADEMVQQEINEFVSIDELEELDKRLANQEDIGQKVDDIEPRQDGNFEDPRAWDDVGVSSEEIDLADDSVAEDSVPDGVDSSDEWKEQQLSDVAKATQSFEAIEESDAPATDGETSPEQTGRGSQQRQEGRQGPANAKEQSADHPQPPGGGAEQRERPDEKAQSAPSGAPTAPTTDAEGHEDGGSILPFVALGLALLAVAAAVAFYVIRVA